MRWLLKQRIFKYIYASPIEILWLYIALVVGMFAREIGLYNPIGIVGYISIYILGMYYINTKTYDINC